MNSIEKISGFFTLLHDGEIESWEGDKGLLKLTIGCTYLAEKIDPAFDLFYLELSNITKLELECWGEPGEPYVVLTTIAEIFSKNLEIVHSEVANGDVIVTLYSRFAGLYGGRMTLNAADAKAFRHDKKEISIDELTLISDNYWDSFGAGK